MATSTGPAPTKVVTGKVRLSYCHLDKPHSQSGKPEDAKYSVMLLIPKSDKTTIRKIEAAQQAALEQGKGSKFGGSIPKVWKNTFRDADEELDLEKQPEAEGCMFLNVTAKTQPGIVDKNVEPILDMSEVYSGMYARISMNAFAFNTQGNKGVSFGLNHVQKVADGEFLGGRSNAEDDFEAIEDEDDDDLL